VAMADPYAEKPVLDGTPSQDAVDRDTRSPAQRNHDGLHAALRAILASGQLGQHNGLPPASSSPPPSHSWRPATGRD
jgi:hypothetical protein